MKTKTQHTDKKDNKITLSGLLRKFDRYFYDIIEKELVPIIINKRAFDLALSTNIEILNGKTFYYFFKIISQDFDNDCRKAFEEIIKAKKAEYLAKKKPRAKKKENEKEKFINQFTTPQLQVAEKAGIAPDRLSRILSESLKDFYAYEVISIALSQDISPKSAFEQLYKMPLTDADILREPKKTTKK